MLQEKLDAFAKEMPEKIPAETLETMKKAAEKLEGIENQALKEGDEAPPFVLEDVEGNQVSSEDLLKQGPLIVSFYRGNWCPFCNMEIVAWQNAYPQVKEAGAELVAISPNVQKKVEDTVTHHKLHFPVLMDSNNKVARKFGLVFQLPEELIPVYKRMGVDFEEEYGDEEYELPMPATYIIEDGVITYAFVDADYKKRAEPSEVIERLTEDL